MVRFHIHIPMVLSSEVVSGKVKLSSVRLGKDFIFKRFGNLWSSSVLFGSVGLGIVRRYKYLNTIIY